MRICVYNDLLEDLQMTFAFGKFMIILLDLVFVFVFS